VPYMICSLLKFPRAAAAPITNTNVPVTATSQAPASKGDTSQLEAIPPGKVLVSLRYLVTRSFEETIVGLKWETERPR
jgi:hypothetical protein